MTRVSCWVAATASCTTGAPEPACADFLKYLDSTPVQKQVVGANVGLPANPVAASALTLPAMQTVVSANHSAPYIQTYFDIAFPTSVGQALDTAVANYFGPGQCPLHHHGGEPGQGELITGDVSATATAGQAGPR